MKFPWKLSITGTSAIAGMLSVWWASNSADTAAESEKRQIMQSYTTIYADIAKNDGDAMNSVKAFRSSNRQASVQILSGLLVVVIDSMRITDDPRTKTWAKFIEKIPGPLVQKDFCLEDFARFRETVSDIEVARKNVMKNENITEFKCREDYYQSSRRPHTGILTRFFASLFGDVF